MIYLRYIGISCLCKVTNDFIICRFMTIIQSDDGKSPWLVKNGVFENQSFRITSVSIILYFPRHPSSARLAAAPALLHTVSEGELQGTAHDG